MSLKTTCNINTPSENTLLIQSTCSRRFIEVYMVRKWKILTGIPCGSIRYWLEPAKTSSFKILKKALVIISQMNQNGTNLLSSYILVYSYIPLQQVIWIIRLRYSRWSRVLPQLVQGYSTPTGIVKLFASYTMS